ncbi:MAG: hypothetical protein AB7O96_17995 [Pseudobdellovibrionaceae bacterium]
MIKKLFWIVFTNFCVAGCISGPKNADQKFSEKLNADSYESSGTVLGVPVLTRAPLVRKISGKVLCGEGLSLRPATYVAISLLDNGKVVATSSTDMNGEYNLSTSVSADKTYKIHASSKCGTSSKEVSLKDQSNFDLILKN